MANPVYGGQAVMEGVMMRGGRAVATAVRRPDGEVVIKRQELQPIARRCPILGWPLVRGSVALVEMLSIGISALMWSANQAAPDGQELTKKDMVLSVVLSFGLAIVIFILAPTLVAGWLQRQIPVGFWLNLLEGLMRVGLFVGYIAIIARLEDIQRFFAYHGAEHKAVNALEAGEELTAERVRRYPVFHPRCGTAFMLYVMVIAIAFFSFFGWPVWWMRLVIRLAALPFIAGLAYEITRLAGASCSPWVKWALAPGLALQRLTTREPDDSMLEVAIAALKTVRDMQKTEGAHHA